MIVRWLVVQVVVVVAVWLVSWCSLEVHAILEEDMTWRESSHLMEWLQPFDHCLMKQEQNLTVKEITDHCVQEVSRTSHRSASASLLPIRCRVGNTWPSRSEYCDSTDIPFAQRTNLKSIISKYDNPKDLVLKDFFLALAKESGLLLMIGDSVMQQFFGAVACELEREGVWKDPNQFTNTDETRTISFPHLKTVATAKFLPVYHLVNGRYDRVANAAMHSVQQTIEKAVAAGHRRIVVLVNMGLHYVDNPVKGFTKDDYREQVTTLLRYLNTVAQEQSMLPENAITVNVVWRETTAQHFATPNGYWPGSKFSTRLQFGCVPLQDSSPQVDWRNRAVEDVIAAHQLSHVKILPFYNLTVPLWSEHPNGHLRDCTHFCWSPMLYQSIFHYLRSMMIDLGGSSLGHDRSHSHSHGHSGHPHKKDNLLVNDAFVQ